MTNGYRPWTRWDWEAYLGRPLEGYEILRVSGGRPPWGIPGYGGRRSGGTRAPSVPTSWEAWKEEQEDKKLPTLLGYYFQTPEKRRKAYAEGYPALSQFVTGREEDEMKYMEGLYRQWRGALPQARQPWHVAWGW